MAETFAPQDFDRIKDADSEVTAFLDFVLDRFKVHQLAHGGPDVDERIKRGGGFVSYRIDRPSVFNEELENINIIEFTDNDRGPGSSRAFAFPKSALFEKSERELDDGSYFNGTATLIWDGDFKLIGSEGTDRADRAVT